MDAPIRPFPQAPATAPPGSSLAERNWRLELGLKSQREEQQFFEQGMEKPVRPGELLAPVTITRLGSLAGNTNEAFLEQFFSSAVLEENITLEETLPHRVRIGWRIVREMARLKNLVDENEMLVEGLPWDPCPWTLPTSFHYPSNPEDMREQKRFMSPLFDVVQLISRDPAHPRKSPGLPLLPPEKKNRPAPEEGAVAPYEPIRDHELMRWIHSAVRIADHYSMEHTVDAEGNPCPDPEGRLGLAGMFDPVICRRAFPTRGQIEAFEELIVEETVLKLAGGRVEARKYLQTTYGLRDRESRGVLAMAMVELRSRTDTDIEEKRSLMEHRLEDFVGRSRESMDMNNEIKALKIITVVQGLTRTEPEDIGREMMDAMHRVAASTPQETPELRVIDAPQTLPPA